MSITHPWKWLFRRDNSLLFAIITVFINFYILHEVDREMSSWGQFYPHPAIIYSPPLILHTEYISQRIFYIPNTYIGIKTLTWYVLIAYCWSTPKMCFVRHILPSILELRNQITCLNLYFPVGRTNGYARQLDVSLLKESSHKVSVYDRPTKAKFQVWLWLDANWLKNIHSLVGGCWIKWKNG